MSDVRLYGNWTRPRMQGVFGLGLGICALLLVAAMALIFAVLSGGPAAAAVVVG